MKKILLSLIFFIIFPVVSWAGCTGTSPNLVADSPSYADVNACVGMAVYDDTITVPAGSATWNSTLTITKGITLQGNGIGSTVITSGQGDNSRMIIYSPSAPQNDEPLRITGFTFDGNQHSTGIEIKNPNDSYHIHNIRIDHNRFYHCGYGGSSGAGVVFGNLDGGNQGRVSGVVDNNTFDDCTTFTRAYGSYSTSWNLDPVDLGGPTGMYVESNTMTMSSSWCSSHAASLHHASSGWGGRYAYRFNDITYDNGGWQDGFDVHGQQVGVGHRGSISTEIYRNNITYGTSSRFIYYRGGTGMIYDNVLLASYDPQLTCELYSRWPGDPTACTEWPCEDMLHGYLWNNTNNGSIQTSVFYSYGLDSDILDENRDYWLHKTSFNGTSGVGRGTLASRPATCTTGVGYWATDQGEWDSTNGATPDGRFYKCTSTDTWELFYTPHAYPHPLTEPSPGDVTAPTIVWSWPDGDALSCSSNPKSVSIQGEWSEAAITHFCRDDSGVTCDADTSFDDMLSAAVGGVTDVSGGISFYEIQSHACGTSGTYWVRSQDTATNESLAVEISFSVNNPPFPQAPTGLSITECLGTVKNISISGTAKTVDIN